MYCSLHSINVLLLKGILEDDQRFILGRYIEKGPSEGVNYLNLTLGDAIDIRSKCI